MLSIHNRIRNERQKEIWEIPKYWKIKQYILNNSWFKEEITMKIRKYFN